MHCLGSHLLTFLGEPAEAALPPKTWTEKPQSWELLGPFRPHGGTHLRLMLHPRGVGRNQTPQAH